MSLKISAKTRPRPGTSSWNTSTSWLKKASRPLALGALDGWTLTDFFENLYLNIAGPEMYHKLFVTHEVEWTDPTVISALEHFAEAVSPTDTRLYGRLRRHARHAASSTPWTRS